MTVYCVGHEVDVLGADIPEDHEEPPMVWWAYREHELDDDEDSHRGIEKTHMNQLRADDGMTEILDALADLPNSRIRGYHPWAREARGETGGEAQC